MSGTIIPGQTIDVTSVNRQTIPYADRPIVDRTGHLTRYGYQWAQRLQQGLVATISNVGTVISNVDTINVDLGSIEAHLGTIDAEIATIEQELSAGLGNIPPLPAMPPAPPVMVAPLAPAVPPPPIIPPPNPLAPAAAPVVLSPAPLPRPVAPPLVSGAPLALSPLPAQPPVPLAPAIGPSSAIGAWQLLGKFTPSAVSSFIMVPPAGFSRYRIALQDLAFNTSGAFAALQVSINGGASFITTAVYTSFGFYLAPGGTTFNGYSSATSSVTLCLGASNASNVSVAGEYDIDPGNATTIFSMLGAVRGFASTPGWYAMQAGGGANPGGVVNAFLVGCSSGTMSAAAWLFGLP